VRKLIIIIRRHNINKNKLFICQLKHPYRQRNTYEFKTMISVIQQWCIYILNRLWLCCSHRISTITKFKWK